jgi:hypothetical protein
VVELAAQILQKAECLGVIVRPRQPRLARSSTAHTSDRHEASPGSRPMTLTRRRVSPKVRSGSPSEIEVEGDEHEIWHDRVSGALYLYWRHHQRPTARPVEDPAIALLLTELPRESIARLYPSIALPA